MGKEISIAEERFPQGRLYRADVKVSSFHEGDCGLTISMSETYPPVDSSLTTAAESGYDASINAPPGSNNARCGMRRKRRWRSVRIGIGPSSDPKIKKTAVKAPCSLYKRWFMSQNQVQRQMRLAMLEMRPEIARVLETLAAECSGRGRTRDFFKKSDRDLNNMLSRTELQRALVDRGLILQDKEVTSLMAFFDPRGRGYVGLDDLHDGLRTIRAVRQLTQTEEQEIMTAYDHRTPRLRQVPDTVSHLGSALLTPLVLNTSPSPTLAEKLKRQRRRGRVGERGERSRRLERRKDVKYLDITDPEIKSLVNFLTGVGLGGADCNAEITPNLFETNDYRQSTDSDQTERFYPLSNIMATLKSVASSVPVRESKNVRGPGVAAIPYSAARVCLVLRCLQRSWCCPENVRLHRHLARKKPLVQSRDENFSNKELNAAVRFFDLDGSGHIRLEDVMTVFHNIRAERCLQGRPSTAAMPILAKLGRHLKEKRISAVDFVHKAVLSSHDTNSDRKKRQSLEWEVVRRSTTKGTRPAKKGQFGRLLCEEMRLTQGQRDLILSSVGKSGLIWGAELSAAIRRATTELGHRQLARREHQRSKWRGRRHGLEGACGNLGNSEMSHKTSTAVSLPSILSRSRCQNALADEARIEGGLKTTPRINRHSHRSQEVHPGGFNQPDAAMILDIFATNVKGLRDLTAGSAVARWRNLKRRSLGRKSYEAGRSASRSLQLLLHIHRWAPEDWFSELLEISRGNVEDGTAGPSVAVNVILSRVKRLARAATKGAPPFGEMLGREKAEYSTAGVHWEINVPRTGSDCSTVPQTIDRRDWEWEEKRLFALSNHLDPCQEGRVTWEGFLDGLRDCGRERVAYPDSRRLGAVTRFETALCGVSCTGVCEIIWALANEARGGVTLVEFVRRMGDGMFNVSHEVNAASKEDRGFKPLTVRELQAITWSIKARSNQRRSERALALRKRLGDPNNALALDTIRRIDEIMVKQGKRLVMEFNQADSNHSGGVDRAELKRAVKNLVRPSPLLRFERKQRRKRQLEEAMAIHEAKYWNEEFTKKMEALHRSKASHFLEAVSNEIRHRRLQIRDVFREVDEARSGSLCVEDLLENTYRSLGLVLRRDEAEELVKILDVNGDRSIECEELELALRAYRRYRWERVHMRPRKTFDRELSSLFHVFSQAFGAIGEGSQLSVHSSKGGGSSTNGGVPEVSRGEIVAALMRLRGDTVAAPARAGKCHCRAKLLRASGPRDHRRRKLARAVGKIAHCCRSKDVRVRTAMIETLSRFDATTPAGGHEAGLICSTDLWYWLRSLSMPKYIRVDDGSDGGGARGGDGKRMSTISNRRNLTRREAGSDRGPRGSGFSEIVVNRPLLDDEEASLVLESLRPRKAPREKTEGARHFCIDYGNGGGVGGIGGVGSFDGIGGISGVGGVGDVRGVGDFGGVGDVGDVGGKKDLLRPRKAARNKTEGTGHLVSVNDLWDLLLHFDPSLFDVEEQRRLDAEQIAAARHHAAVNIQCAVRQWQGERRAADGIRLREEEEKRQKAAQTLQCLTRQRQARVKACMAKAHRLHEANLFNSASRIQALARGRRARLERRAAEEATGIAAANAEEAARQAEEATRIATAKAEKAARQAEEATRIAATKAEEAARLAATTTIQRVARGRWGRIAAKGKAARQAEENARQAEKVARLKEETARLVAAIDIKRLARGRLEKVTAKEEATRQAEEAARQAEETVRHAAVLEIQRVARGRLGRIAAREAEIEARAIRAPMSRRGLEWRRQRIVGSRGEEGLAAVKRKALADRQGRATTARRANAGRVNTARASAERARRRALTP
ncbi:unnamed protein product [Ascophyllum nodosum]